MEFNSNYYRTEPPLTPKSRSSPKDHSQTQNQQQIVTDQLGLLYNEISDINIKYYESYNILKQKNRENQQLKQKLLYLQRTIENLYQTQHASKGCCTRSCNLLQYSKKSLYFVLDKSLSLLKSAQSFS